MPKAPDPMVSALGAIAARLGEAQHPFIRRLHAEANRVHSSATALDNVKGTRSPLDTPAAHVLKVAKLARKFDSEVTAMLNRSGAIVREGLEDIQRRIDQKVNLRADPKYEAEIRAAFRGLNAEGRASLIEQLVEQNRGPELAAIVKAPGLLSGIADEQCAIYERLILAKHAAAELDEQQRLNDALATTLTVSRAASDMVKRLTDPRALAEIERADADANAAGTAFDQSLQ